jgi:hypothetical protein
MDDNLEKLDEASLEIIQELLLTKRAKMKYVFENNWDEAAVAREVEKDILAHLKIKLITIDYLEGYIRDRKIKEIFYENR